MRGERRASGWIVIDKPQGLSSARVVGRVRRAFGDVKAGHAGTLDPLASGVLPVALGEATKTIAYAMSARKRYRFCVCWGSARTTDDSEGEIIAESAVRPPPAAVAAMLPHFVGTLTQTPPAYCALKSGGRRAYAVARRGQMPTLSPRPVEIFSLRLIAVLDPEHAEFEAEVGKGTYIRALARDLAAALGTFGHVAALRRLAVGPFTEAHAIPLECLDGRQHIAQDCGFVLPIDTALGGIPAVALAGAEAERLRRGQRVAFGDPSRSETGGRLDPGTVVSAWHGGALVALAKVDDGGLRPLRVMNC
jgi:tRNA pseudouridine55 synthase